MIREKYIKEKYIKEKYLKVLFVIFVFLVMLIWSIAQPVDEGPDEKMKYDIIKYIVEFGKLPHGGAAEVRSEIWGLSYGFTPILSYMIAAVFVKFASLFTANIAVMYIAARLVSVLCCTGMCVFVIKIADKLFKSKIKWLFIIIATILPQLLFIGSYINNDSLALFSISIIVYGWIKGLESNWDYISCSILGVGLGICALSYYNAYGYILTSIIVFILSFFIKSERKKISVLLLNILKKGILVAGIAFLIAGWWFIRSWVLYDGDFLGLKISNEYAQEYAMDKCKPSNIVTPDKEGLTLKEMLVDRNWIKITYFSFIATFSVMSFQMSKLFYLIYLGLIFAGGLGYILKCFTRKSWNLYRTKKEKLLLLSMFVINIIIPIGLSLYYSYYSDFQPQGRYIMPMIIPFAYFIVKGIEFYSNKINSIRIKNYFIYGICGLFTLLPIYTLYRILDQYGKL